jgi:hypothetical protein
MRPNRSTAVNSGSIHVRIIGEVKWYVRPILSQFDELPSHMLTVEIPVFNLTFDLCYIDTDYYEDLHRNSDNLPYFYHRHETNFDN